MKKFSFTFVHVTNYDNVLIQAENLEEALDKANDLIESGNAIPTNSILELTDYNEITSYVPMNAVQPQPVVDNSYNTLINALINRIEELEKNLEEPAVQTLENGYTPMRAPINSDGCPEDCNCLSNIGRVEYDDDDLDDDDDEESTYTPMSALKPKETRQQDVSNVDRFNDLASQFLLSLQQLLVPRTDR